MKKHPVYTLFYDCCLLLLSLVLLPKLLYMMFFHNKYRSNFLKRFGKDFPQINKNGRQLIWIHAVSVGETRAITPLAKRIKEDHPDSLLIISSITETGHAEAKRAIPFADHHLFLPFDFSWVVRSVLEKASPDLLIFCESDFWLNFITEAKAKGARVVLVNGKLSERSFRRYRFFSGFTKRLFEAFDLLCVQNATYKQRFEELGVPEHKLTVTGNIKFDDRGVLLENQKLMEWHQKLGINGRERVLVVGSTHDPEEKMIVQMLPGLLTKYPELKVLIVPRHPERFRLVAEILRNGKISFQCYSDAGALESRVILVDAMGLLRSCYQIASLAVVCGSFTPRVGGHNILEPLWYGVPAVYGPYMYAQADLVVLLGESGAGVEVSSEQLEQTIQRFLDDTDYSRKVVELGKGLVDTLQGSTERTWKIIQTRQ